MTTRKIANIYARRDAMHEALRRFHVEAAFGHGEPWTERDELAVEDGQATAILTAQSTSEVTVYQFDDGREFAVGDVHGPWAVEITPAEVAR